MHRDVSRYRFGRALRPFSLVVSFVSCGLGVALAFRLPDASGWAAATVLLAGLLLQAGVNLINDHADLALIADAPDGDACGRAIRRNYRLGLAVIVAAAVLGLPLLWQAGWSLLLILVLGLLGAVGYTQEPINYKRRGLGVPLVFWLMGVLMITGSQLAVSGVWQMEVIWLSVPVSLLVAALLLSNELRDFECDRADGIHTLSQRLGWSAACWLFALLLLGAPLLNLLFVIAGQLSFGWMTLLALPLLWPLPKLVSAKAMLRTPLVPATGRYLALFGALNIAAVAFS